MKPVKWIPPTVAIVFTLTIVGFLVNVAEVTVGDDDLDCTRDWDDGPHDEGRRELNGCVQHCEVHPIWYSLGHDRDCYWDDDAGNAMNATNPETKE